MEQHKELKNISEYEPSFIDSHTYFKNARKFAEEFYGEEIKRIWSVKFTDVTSDFFFRECVWVIHTSGFSATAVSKFWPKLIQAYGDYRSFSDLSETEARDKIKNIVNNSAKIKAIHTIAKTIDKNSRIFSWEIYKNTELNEVDKLQKLPYIGKITKYHLARNIGILEVVKPDLHLVRLAEYWGYSDCIEMCKDIRPNGMPLGIVDLILWYSASTFGTLEIKK